MNKKLEKKIMSKIAKENIKIKPKWYFGLIEKGQILLLSAIFITSSVLIASVFYFIELIQPKSLMNMGNIGRQVLLENLPYLLILSTTFTIFFSLFIYQKTGDNYKKQKRQIYLFVLISITLLAIILTSFRVMFENGAFLF